MIDGVTTRLQRGDVTVYSLATKPGKHRLLGGGLLRSPGHVTQLKIRKA
jgi:hypothetical protein